MKKTTINFLLLIDKNIKKYETIQYKINQY
jgi:hypothetical protein